MVSRYSNPLELLVPLCAELQQGWGKHKTNGEAIIVNNKLTAVCMHKAQYVVGVVK